MRNVVPVPSDIQVLIVDDEKTLCTFLEEALSGLYHVTTCNTGQEATALLGSRPFDVLITDLRLPDISGLDVLRFAKERDEFIEVIVITGYASLDTASQAINLGASSYLIKPLSLEELTRQIQRVVAARGFHLKSLRILQQDGAVPEEFKDHLYDITTLYHFSRKMMISLELPDVFQVILQDTNERTNALACSIGISYMEFGDIYFMPHFGVATPDSTRLLFESVWDQCFGFLDRSTFQQGATKVTCLDGRPGTAPDLSAVHTTHIPMLVKGKTIGALVIFGDRATQLSENEYQFLHVYAALVSSIVEHAYTDFQAHLLAKTDSLTGIANHRLFSESIEREVSRADRRKSGFSLIMIDIDDFKKINDSHGHLVGDKVLKDLARRMSGAIRRGDLLARYGGEEFALILPDTEIVGAKLLAERIRKAIADHPLTLVENRIPYTASLGVAAYDGNRPQTKDDLIHQADRALYASKNRGKNCVTTA